jgi:hypothetical protein
MGQLRDRMEQDLKLKGVSPATIIKAIRMSVPKPRRMLGVFLKTIGNS